MLKNIPSGVVQGSTFKRTRSFRLPAGSPPSSGAPSSDDDPSLLPDYGVEADQLANARVDGTAIMPANEEVRRRAALELGLRPFLHGGSTSALCADIAWEDPRTDDDLEADERRWRAQNPSNVTTQAGPTLEGDESGPNLSYTEAADGMRIVWEDPVETVNWADDPRLDPFENRFFGMGGKTSGKGF